MGKITAGLFIACFVAFAQYTPPPSTGGSGGSPTGSAGGSLSGTYPNPTIANLTTANNILCTSSAGVAGECSGNNGQLNGQLNIVSTTEPWIFLNANTAGNFATFGVVISSSNFGTGTAVGDFVVQAGNSKNLDFVTSGNLNGKLDISGRLVVQSGGAFGFSSTTTAAGSLDTLLSRSSAGVWSFDTSTVGNGLGSWVAASATLNGLLKFAGTNTTAVVAGAIGTTCPAVTCTAAYTWVKATSADGSAVYFPVWK